MFDFLSFLMSNMLSYITEYDFTDDYNIINNFSYQYFGFKYISYIGRNELHLMSNFCLLFHLHSLCFFSL